MKSHIICANGRALVTAQVFGELRPASFVSLGNLQLSVVKETGHPQGAGSSRTQGGGGGGIQSTVC